MRLISACALRGTKDPDVGSTTHVLLKIAAIMEAFAW